MTTEPLMLRMFPEAPTVWLTGLSGAGKTTIAHALSQRLAARGVANAILDGDELRATISADLGFSREDRAEQVRRVAHLARILGDAGVIALVALVSPIRADRDAARMVHRPGRFIEVHVATSIDVCEERDVKGLYRRALDREISDFTGISQEYEPPLRAEATVNGGLGSPEEIAARLESLLTSRRISAE
jgi:adenylyl-sulfate kinase